ncbi:MAG: penicillin-binding protein 1B, partial [Gammaproteobacteria bacterium]|nr:penicillin-binding protein 1B [Gammaproteobacteria bacterium]
MARRSRKNLREYLSRRMIYGLAGFAALLVAAFALWIWLLDRQIVSQFEGRRWDLPAQVYARPLELYAGLRLSADELQRELVALGYSPATSIRTQGTYARLTGRIVLMTRPFQFWDGAQPAQKATISFGAGGIIAMTDERGRDLPLLRLDPPFIGNIFTAHGEDRIV